MMDERVIDAQMKLLRERRQEEHDFKRDRLGHNGYGKPSRITYMAHAKGYVMARHPGCIPFTISEALWRSFPFWVG